jgi:meso-butanediol dehydrogenase / (S,S)-butanediol dehydrogenase / diacetyl reductase
MNRLDGRRVLVTGAASGIGRATAQRLVAEGATVACVDRDKQGLDAVVDELGKAALPYELDLLHRDAIAPTVAQVIADLGGLDAACNIAAIAGFRLDLEQTLDDWDRIIGVNLTGTWLVCQAVLPALIESRGNIVNTTSTAATNGTPYQTAYATSKGGVISLTRSLAVNHAAAGVRANCVAPGPIETPIVQQYALPADADPSVLGVIMPFGTMGQPDDVASVYAFLVSDDARHVSGHVLKVDAGQRC